MVIFRSYVSLPEGTGDSGLYNILMGINNNYSPMGIFIGISRDIMGRTHIYFGDHWEIIGNMVIQMLWAFKQPKFRCL